MYVRIQTKEQGIPHASSPRALSYTRVRQRSVTQREIINATFQHERRRTHAKARSTQISGATKQ